MIVAIRTDITPATSQSRRSSSFVGPEHMLAGLVEVTDTFDGDLLMKYALTPQMLRQQAIKFARTAEAGPQSLSDTPQRVSGSAPVDFGQWRLHVCS